MFCLFFLLIRLNSRAGKMKQILCSDGLPERARNCPSEFPALVQQAQVFIVWAIYSKSSIDQAWGQDGGWKVPLFFFLFFLFVCLFLFLFVCFFFHLDFVFVYKLAKKKKAFPIFRHRDQWPHTWPSRHNRLLVTDSNSGTVTYKLSKGKLKQWRKRKYNT